MKTLLLSLILLVSMTSIAQIRLRQNAPIVKDIPVYDSTRNIEYQSHPEDYRMYVGQKISFYPGMTLNKGYFSFYTKDGDRYKSSGILMETPDFMINGREFRIVDFEYRTDSDKNTCFTLVSEDMGDTLFWCTNTLQSDARPVLSAFYNYYVDKYVGKKFKHSHILDGERDINTGEYIRKNDFIWTCTHFIAMTPKGSVSNDLYLVFTNEKGNEIAIDYWGSDIEKFEDAEAAAQREKQLATQHKLTAQKRRDDLTRRFGADTADMIMNGMVQIGMTAEQCRLSWGPPDKVNKTTTSAVIHEQWVYDSGSYLYFDNGILTAIQN